jgi:hypothetical protein
LRQLNSRRCTSLWSEDMELIQCPSCQAVVDCQANEDRCWLCEGEISLQSRGTSVQDGDGNSIRRRNSVTLIEGDGG